MNYQPLTKKQVGALLKVLSSDISREVLTELSVSKDESGHTVLVATDGYVLAVLPAGDFSDIADKTISRDALTRWYKLASTKDLLTSEELHELAGEPAGVYPNWLRQIRDATPGAIEQVILNPDYLVTMEKLAGDGLAYTTHGQLGALVASREGARYVVMPKKAA
ncbi:hypothetical protein [Gordonia sp. CNJ-863]|uniref:hypothetical protein n=1 Tax=Gordonia sp. CNJ-863 TaxID=1904963 RepID=UPI0011150B15|nr:hypothetical protein [Gordonia sp. CNJ-863]